MLVKFILGTILAFILLASMFTHSIQAEGGNSIWLTKTKRGIDVSCPYGYKYEETSIYSCTKKGETSFNVSLYYDDLFVEEEFFNEKDIMKQAIIAVKLLKDVKILEKKTASWFGKITADIKYESAGVDGLQRMVVFNDGTVILMHFFTNYNISEADKMLSNHVKILEPNQVKETEKKNAEYAKQAQEKANLKQAEEKKTAEKKAAEKKAAIAKKAIEDAKIKVIDDKLKIKAWKDVELWKERIKQLDQRFVVVTTKHSESYSKIKDDAERILVATEKEYYYNDYNELYSKFLKSIELYKDNINKLKNTSKDKIDQVINNNNKHLKGEYDALDSLLQKIENSIIECDFNIPYYGGDMKYDIKFKFIQNEFSGTLKDQNGSPMAGVWISDKGWVSDATAEFMIGLRSATATKTDSNGNWKMPLGIFTFYEVYINFDVDGKAPYTREIFYHSQDLETGSCQFT